jgi:hypothetical protein
LEIPVFVDTMGHDECHGDSLGGGEHAD